VFLALFLAVAGISAYLTVTLIISSGDTVVVPDLRSRDVVYVLKILTDLGLNAKVKGFEFDEAVPANHVVYQEPQPGTEIKRGRDIRILISNGSLSVLTPNLVGLPIQQAQIILNENGLCQGQTAVIYSEQTKKEAVIAQVPGAGAMIRRSNCVDLLTSEGPRPTAYKMPDLTGRTVEEAILLIENAGLSPGSITSISIGGKFVNTVVSQEPAAGSRIFRGGTVNLAVNAKGPGAERAALADAGGVRLYRCRAASGFIRERIGIKVNWFGFSADLWDDFVKPGREIWVLIPKNQDVSVSLYRNEELAENRFYPAWHSLRD